jgi:hypothetical protein
MQNPAARRRIWFVLAIACALSLPAVSQTSEDSSEFHFARMAFGAFCRVFGTNRGEPWLRDWPEADHHFTQGLRRLTRIESNGDNRHVDLTDEALFDYPVLYAVKVGFLRLSDYEAGRLREYLLRGGFLIVDDFHGPQEWEEFAASMHRVFADHPIVEVPDSAEIFHVLYDLDRRVQIPGRQAVARGVSWEHPQGVPAHWRGIYDDTGRLLVAINFNMDLGDAWEHADDPYYPEPLTALAYRFGVNYVIYAMTH